MLVNKPIILILLFSLCADACVERFEPRIDETQVNLVVDGQITDQEGYYYIKLSRSTAYNLPVYTPETGAYVEVRNSLDQRIVMYEGSEGMYEQFFPQEFLQVNLAYSVYIRTGDGREYYSVPDTMLPGPPIDSVYYEEEVQGTSDPLYPVNGVRIYTDLVLKDGSARNYRWEMEETWEYHSPYFIQYYYIGYIVDLGNRTDSLMKCWKSADVPGIYTQTCRQISGNRFDRIPLNYVSAESNRLRIKYSLLLKQYSLSEAGFNYWDQIRKQSQERGGLYEQQPLVIRGNVYNPDDPDERVLGNFSVSSLTLKRMYIEQNFNFAIQDYACRLIEIGQSNPLGFYNPNEYPVYLIKPEMAGPFYTSEDVCFDCREGGGVTRPPDWWE